MKKHNFYAGPSILSQYAIDKTIEGIRGFHTAARSFKL